MKVKTSELKGLKLDWAVALSEVGADFIGEIDDPHFYSTDWALAGPIIERESIFVLREQSGFKGRRLWAATSGANKAVGLNEDSIKLYRDAFYFGPTPLIAAMRCYVASKLGDEVEVPEELLQS
jgi:hypothetical protein